MGLFNFKSSNSSNSSKDFYYEKYGDVDLTKDEDAALRVYNEYFSDDKKGYAHKAAFILKSYVGFDKETYEKCRKGFEASDIQFWYEWLNCIDPQTFVETCEDPEEIMPFFVYLQREYEDYKKCPISEWIDYKTGYIANESKLKRLFNFSNDFVNEAPKSFIMESVLYPEVHLLYSADKADELVPYVRLELEMYKAGIKAEERKQLLYLDNKLLPYTVVAGKYEKYLSGHQTKSMSLDEFN